MNLNLATIGREIQKGVRYVVLYKKTPTRTVVAIAPKNRILERLIKPKAGKHTTNQK